jgi:transcriptional regulator with XRE-family HTH domain
LGLNQDEFADKIGVSKNSIGAYERGQTEFKVPLLLVMGDVGVDIGYVLTGRRSDSSLGFPEQHHLDMLSRLSMREREAVFALVATLAGELVSLQELDLANIGKTLHDKNRDFRGSGE